MALRTVSETEVGDALAAAGLGVDAATAAALAAFLNLLARWNRVFNLTGVRRPEEAIARHVVESLVLAPFLIGTRIADVGSGAGVPGLPLAVVEPGRRFTLIESRAKRCRFLRHAAAELGLDNVSVAEARAEDLDAPPFDTVLARAVAKPAGLLALCRPLVRAGGRLVLLTSAELADVYADVAADFVPAPVPMPSGAPIRSVVVALDRRR